MRIHIARGIAEIERLRPAWDFLCANLGSATLFQSFAWNRLAAIHFADRESPYIVLAESDSGMALIPAGMTRNGLTLLGEELFDYRDALAMGSEEAMRAAWAQLAGLHLPLSFTALRGEAAGERWRALAPAPFVNAPQVLRQGITAEAFAATHSSLGRTLRRLAKHGAELRRHDGAASELIGWIYRRKAAQLDGAANNLFGDPRRVEFMIAACRLDPASCESFTFEAAGRAIAALVTFRDRSVRRFYTIWFDAAWAHDSPGTALCYEATLRSLAEGLDCDYMTGEQPHKLRFATSLAPLFRVSATADALTHVAGQKTQLVA